MTVEEKFTSSPHFSKIRQVSDDLIKTGVVKKITGHNFLLTIWRPITPMSLDLLATLHNEI